MKREIYTSNPRAFQREVNRLNRRAKRVGVDAIVIVPQGTKQVTRRILSKNEDGDVSESSYPCEVSVFDVHLPEVEDYAWTLEATLTPVEGEDRMFVEPHVSGFDSARWESADPCQCDHCHTNRNRHALFVVRHKEDGRVQQVGRQCFADYVGHDGLLKLEFQAIICCTFKDGDWDLDRSGGAGDVQLIDVRATIGLAEILRELDGQWQNNVKNDWGDIVTDGTHRRAAKHVTGRWSIEGDLAKRAGDENDPIWAKVDRIIERFAELDTQALDEFGQALQYALGFAAIPAKKAGLIAYAGEFLRNLDRKAELEAKRATMKWVGTVGKRETFADLKVIRVSGFETAYGYCEFINFEDNDGNLLVWKTGSADLSEGEVVTLKATVKEHTEFRGTPQTIITRCKVAS